MPGNRSGDRDLVDRDGSPGHLWLARYPVTAGLPQDGAPTIAALEALRDAGGQYLLVPEGGTWLLQRDPSLQRHLDARYRLVADEPGLARLYDLRRLRERVRAAGRRVRAAGRRLSRRP